MGSAISEVLSGSVHVPRKPWHLRFYRWKVEIKSKCGTGLVWKGNRCVIVLSSCMRCLFRENKCS